MYCLYDGDSRCCAAAMMGLSCLLLAYSAYVVPMQLSFWITDDLCNPFPTLYSDAVVDTYFMVRFRVVYTLLCLFFSPCIRWRGLY